MNASQDPPKVTPSDTSTKDDVADSKAKESATKRKNACFIHSFYPRFISLLSSYPVFRLKEMIQVNQRSQSQMKKRVSAISILLQTTLEPPFSFVSAPTWFEMDDEKNLNVYVSGLPNDVTIEEFKEMMSKYGIIMENEDGEAVLFVPKIIICRMNQCSHESYPFFAHVNSSTGIMCFMQEHQS